MMRAAPVALLLLLACSDPAPGPGWGLERMIDQPSVEAFERSPLFENGSAMRRPPAGTLPHTSDPWVETVVAWEDSAARVPTGAAATGFGARYPDTIPIPIGEADLARGRERFNTYCAVCHGRDGWSTTPVARLMVLRRPPTLHEENIRTAPAGRLYAIITSGYGFMPSYAAELEPHDRWRVIAYVRALQLSQRAPVEVLDAADRARLQAADTAGAGGS